jgi:hypothetical protein
MERKAPPAEVGGSLVTRREVPVFPHYRLLPDDGLPVLSLFPLNEATFCDTEWVPPGCHIRCSERDGDHVRLGRRILVESVL